MTSPGGQATWAFVRTRSSATKKPAPRDRWQRMATVEESTPDASSRPLSEAFDTLAAAGAAIGAARATSGTEGAFEPFRQARPPTARTTRTAGTAKRMSPAEEAGRARETRSAWSA